MPQIERSDREERIIAAISKVRPSAYGWFRTNCPLCNIVHGSADKKQSFGVLGGSGVYHCFRCGSAGKLKKPPEFVRRIQATDPSADELAAARVPPEGFYYLGEEPAKSSLIGTCPRAYLASRGFPDVDRLIADGSVGACFHGYLFGRVVVPVLATDGESWLGWVSRAWSPKPDECPKEDWRPYLYPPGQWRAQVLYNHKALLVETDEPCLVVEGSFDSLWVGLDDSVASLGKIGNTHRLAMLAAKRPIVFVNDGDEWEVSEREAMLFRVRGRRAGALHLKPKLDPDDYEPAELKHAAKKSLDSVRCSVRV